MAGVASKFLRAVLTALGWDRKPPPFDYMMFYRAKVDAAAADGSTVDVTPEDDRIPKHSGVPVRTCLPGCTVVVKTDTIVALGWEKGDPSRYYAAPIFESAGGITKVVVKADMVYLGDEAGAEELVKKSEFMAHSHQVPYVPGTAGSATATSASPTDDITGTSKLKAV